MTYSRIKIIAMFTLTIFAMALLHITLAKSVELKNEKLKPSTDTRMKLKYDLDLCWKHEKFITKTECMQCQSNEENELLACKETGNKQQIECDKSKTKTYISFQFVLIFNLSNITNCSLNNKPLTFFHIVDNDVGFVGTILRWRVLIYGCPFVDSVEKRRFWVFEAASLACALLSNAVVWWRRRSLQYFHYQRVKRQMSDSSV